MTTDTAPAEDALITRSDPTRNDLRIRLREMRSVLAGDLVTQSSEAAAAHLADTEQYKLALHLAAYVAVGNELDPGPLVARAHADGKTIYLPCIRPDRQLLFARWQPGEPLQESRLGIPEPAISSQTIAPDELDLVIVPSVGFDKTGNRLGNGGGYYDRNFAFRLQQRTAHPILVGYAHAHQECAQLEANDWDVPLDLVVTERGIRHFPTKHPPAHPQQEIDR